MSGRPKGSTGGRRPHRLRCLIGCGRSGGLVVPDGRMKPWRRGLAAWVRCTLCGRGWWSTNPGALRQAGRMGLMMVAAHSRQLRT